MAYTPVHAPWRNLPNRTTPVNAAAIGHIEQGVVEAHEELDGRLSEAGLNATYAPVSVASDVSAAVASIAGKADKNNLGPHPELFPALVKMVNADTERINMVCLGGSQFEGVGSTTFEARFPRKLQDVLNRRYGGVELGETFVPARRNAGVPVEPGFWEVTGNTANNSRGPRGNAAELQYHASTPGTITGTFKATKFRFFFYRLVNGTVTITIDGGTPATFNATSGRELLWESGDLTNEDHTVVITATSGSLLFCGGEHLTGPADKGIHLWDLSVSGASANKRANGAEWPGADNWSDWIGIAYTPDLFVFGLLFNDAYVSTAAEYKGYLQACINKLRAKSADVPILLMPGWGPTTSYANWVEPKEAYFGVLAELAAENDRVAFHNLDELVPSHSNTAWPIYNGSPHMNDRGQAMQAKMSADALELSGAVSLGGMLPAPVEPEEPEGVTPLSVTDGLLARFSAQSLELADGAPVASWPVEQGSKTVPMAQATAGYRPTYRATGAGGGLPAVEFVRESTQSLAAAWGETTSTPVTVFFVGELTVTPPASQNIMSGIASSNYLGVQNTNDNRVQMLPGATSGTLRTLPGVVTAGVHVFGGKYDGATSTIHFDQAGPTNSGSMVTTGESAAASLTGISVGRSATSETTGNFTGKLAEVIVYGRALSAGEISTVMNQLGSMYGVTIAA